MKYEVAKKTLKHLLFRPGLRPYCIRGGALKGLSFEFDLHQDTQAWRGVYEEPLQKWLTRYIKAGDTCLDIGGADGYFALLMAKLSGVEGHVHAFEPSEKTEHIRQNFALNAGMPLAHLHCYQDFVGAKDNAQTQTVSIDALLDVGKIEAVHVIKIDVDGGEVDALQGMSRTLEKFHPHLFIETHSYQLQEEVSEITRNLGYSMHLEMPAAYEHRPSLNFNAFYYSEN